MKHEKTINIKRFAELVSSLTKEQSISVMGYVEGILAGKSLALATQPPEIEVSKTETLETKAG